MTEVVSNEPVVAALPTPISVEPRVAPAEAAEVTRQAEEAKVAAAEPAKAEPAAKEDKKPSASIRDSLAKAREKIEAAPLVAKALSVSAKDTPAADAKAAEPATKAESAVTRGEDGKFVSAKADTKTATDAAGVKVAAPADKDASAPVAAQTPKEPAKPSHTAEPPPARMSAAAKEKWAETPEEVRGEFNRAVTELTKGFEKHRTAAERDQSIAEFHERATKGGTTVKEALSKYVEMEDTLRNPATREKGIEAIFKNVGVSPDEWAAARLNRTPDQVRSQSDATIRSLESRLERAEAALAATAQERVQQRTDTTTEAVTKFAAENPRFEELADDIAFFLKTRTKDLAEAYKLAERLNPAPAPAKVEATAVPAASEAPVRLVSSTPAPSHDAGTRSIAGTPTAGSDPVRKQPSSSIKEAIRRAAAAAR